MARRLADKVATDTTAARRPLTLIVAWRGKG